MTAARQVLTPQDTIERVLELSTADGCVVVSEERSEANVRWANNTLTTNGEMRSRKLAVISVVDGATGTASGVVERSAVTAEDLEPLVRAAEQAARDAGPADDASPLVQPSGDSPGWEAPPAVTSTETLAGFAASLGQAMDAARAQQRLLFGFAEHVMTSTYVGSSTGVRLRNDQPTGKVEINGKSADLKRSAWVGASTRDFGDIDVAALDTDLQQRLAWAERSVELPAGRYDTLLAPTAIADVLIYLYISATARAADEGRTVFSRQGGGNRIGDRLCELPLSLRSDPAAAGLQTSPFFAVTSSNELWSVFDVGMPVGATDWIRDGVLTSLVGSRAWAQRSGNEAVKPMIDNLILDAGSDSSRSLADMAAGVERGLMLTCLWYIREVDPQNLLLTGLTRDGVYLIEDGEVTGAVNNFRFNESPVDLLGRISDVGASSITLPREWNDFFTRTSMPPVRVPDFNMSTVSQAS
ncbi:MAG: peptidase [Pseudonocardiales bacterium]|nr:MAG: peptidase [Pseudonocardiales bacterium]